MPNIIPTSSHIDPRFDPQPSDAAIVYKVDQVPCLCCSTVVGTVKRLAHQFLPLSEAISLRHLRRAHTKKILLGKKHQQLRTKARQPLKVKIAQNNWHHSRQSLLNRCKEVTRAATLLRCMLSS